MEERVRQWPWPVIDQQRQKCPAYFDKGNKNHVTIQPNSGPRIKFCYLLLRVRGTALRRTQYLTPTSLLSVIL
jgi:hypothetical protein